MENNIKKQLISYIDALYPIIYINHFDFKIVDDIIKSISDRRNIIEFTQGLGIIDFTSKFVLKECNLLDFLKSVKDKGFKNNLFIILKDIHNQLNNSEIISLIKYIAYKNLYDENYNASIFIISNKLYIPEELENFITVFDLPFPNISEIKTIMNKFIRSLDIDIPSDVVNQTAWSFKGLDEFQIKQLLNLYYQDGGSLNFDDKSLIFKQKEILIKKTGLLEMITGNESFDDIGGLENLKVWLYKKNYVFKQLDNAMKFGMDAPKGIMITGMPKCGKTLIVKAAANLFEVPLLKLNVSRLIGKHIKDSEKNICKALKLAEIISPCILLVDEIEKVFWRADNQERENNIITYLFNQFLTWMQEKKNLVFVMATANDISRVPLELFEKGCFDEQFYVDLPSNEERKEIITIHLCKHNKWTSDLDIISLVGLTNNYSGADLELMIKKAVENCFIEGKDKLTTEDLKNAQKSIKPISDILQEKIKKNINAIKDKNLKSANKISMPLWMIFKNKESKNEFIDPTAVTLYEVLGKDWWKKRHTNFIIRTKQKDFSVESGFWGYGINLI